MSKAIGIIETNSIASGIEAADGMVKKAPVKLYVARTICPGKYMILIGGDVEDVKSSLAQGQELAKEYLVDLILISSVHHEVFPALEAVTDLGGMSERNSLGVIETFTVASCIVAADAAVKSGGIKLLEIRTAVGMGGKSFVTMLGDVSAVEAAVDSGIKKAQEDGLLVKYVVIPSIARDVLRTFV